MREIILIAMVCFLLTGNAHAIDNTIENRSIEAERFLKAMPPSEMLNGMAMKMAKNLPPEKQQAFMEIISKHLDIDAILKNMKDSMVKHFEADELGKLADFYGSQLGQSAIKKFGTYMADVMPKCRKTCKKPEKKLSEKWKVPQNSNLRKLWISQSIRMGHGWPV